MVWTTAAAVAVMCAGAHDHTHEGHEYTPEEWQEGRMLQWLVGRFDRDGDGFLSYPELASLGRATGAPLDFSWYKQIAPGLGADIEKGFNYELMWRVYKELNNDPEAGIKPDFDTVRKRQPKRLKSAKQLRTLMEKAASSAGRHTDRTTVVSFVTGEDGVTGNAEGAVTGHDRFAVMHGDSYRVTYPADADTAAAIRREFDISASAGAALCRAGEFTWSEIDEAGAKEYHTFLKWTWRNGTRFAGVFDDVSAPQYRATDKPILTMYVPFPENKKHRSMMLEMHVRRLYHVAVMYPGVVFTVRDLEETPRKYLERFGFSKAGDVTGQQTGIVHPAAGLRYRWTPGKAMNEDNLIDFVSKFEEGRLSPHMVVGPTASSLTDQAFKEGSVVLEVTKRNFKKIVMDSDADVVVLLYAPWCGACKAVMPVFHEMAPVIHGRSRRGLLMVQIDATKPVRHPSYQTQKYPTIMLAKKGEKDAPKQYGGPRDYENMMLWLHSTSPKLRESVGYDKKRGGDSGGDRSSEL
eukprot:TRINITY_DN4121_c0_g1_i1.p1 TRINITY_DN4121_c0_g1~~TRINITY_DN4121_c0_g1_i1.p1  ORF type:complete len:521 (+),score=170.85 TRINITY_DN4121_c0_g1_i1:885-2447(+)